MRIKKRPAPDEPESPYIFNHQYGTLLVYACNQKEAFKAAHNAAQGMRLIPAFPTEATK